MKKIASFCVAVLSIFCLSAYASGSWYQIEMIAFSHITRDNLQSEAWPQITMPDFSDKTPANFLSSRYFRLNSQERHIARTPGYQILIHIAWLQYIPEGARSKTVLISQPNADLQGTISTNLNRYFNLNLNLYLQQDGNVYRLLQTRRTKSRELNYIDHPLYGILLEIFPASAPTKAQGNVTDGTHTAAN